MAKQVTSVQTALYTKTCKMYFTVYVKWNL